MKLIKTIGNGTFAYEFMNYRERELNNNERMEGWMRSDFKNRRIPVWDSVRVVRIK